MGIGRDGNAGATRQAARVVMVVVVVGGRSMGIDGEGGRGRGLGCAEEGGGTPVGGGGPRRPPGGCGRGSVMTCRQPGDAGVHDTKVVRIEPEAKTFTLMRQIVQHHIAKFLHLMAYFPEHRQFSDSFVVVDANVATIHHPEDSDHLAQQRRTKLQGVDSARRSRL